MKGKKLLIVAAAALLGVTSLAACGKKKDAPVVVDVQISLAKTSLELQVGESETLIATVTPEGTAVTWSSSNAEVATVDANGKVTAVAEGKCDIVAKAGDKEAKCSLEVVPVPVVKSVSAGIEDINGEMLTQYWDEDEEEYGADMAQIDISIKTVGKAEHLEEFTVTSSNPEIVTVMDFGEEYGWYAISNGVVGKSTITVKSVFDQTKSDSFEISVVEPYVRSASLSSAGLYLVVDNDDFKSQELTGKFEAFGDSKYEPAESFKSSNEAVATVDDDGKVTAVAAGTATITYKVGDKTATCLVTVMPAGSNIPATGAKTFVYASAEDRTAILGELEKYAVANKLTGLTLFGNGGYVIYNDVVQKPTENFVPGFGFGILSSGSLTGDLQGENKTEWKRYLHTFVTDDPHSLNYMDDKGSVVGDLIGYVTSGYFSTFLNETKDGYDWVKDLSTVDRPIPVGADSETGMATKYRIPVRVGADLLYSTTSSTYSAFNNRQAALEDYITPYQIYYTQSYGLARSAENLTGTSAIKGAKAYYDASKNGFNENAWKDIGIKAIPASESGDGKNYIEFEFVNACTPFYAMYYLTSGMFAPVPKDFILAIGGNDLAKGVATWGKSSEDGKLTPKDHWLSTGPYVVEQWDADQQIVFKRNENWDDGVHYKIAGVHINVLPGMKTDPEAALKEFKANKLHSCGIPSTKLTEYVGEDGTPKDERIRMTSGDSTFKLNLNTCNAETWEKLFGVNGTITQTPKSDYWKLKPAMQNKDFVSGLSFALDRKSYAAKLGRTPAGTYFADTYLSDPENGISYNSTDAHKNAVKDLIGEAAGTDEYGYSLAKAQQAFAKAAAALLADGSYQKGDTIKIEIAWMEASDEDQFHKPLEAMIEKAFNEAQDDLTLDLVFWCGQEWSDVYYKKMMLGQFDIGFGSISGNSYNPLNFLEVLRSDNSSGFTLNWGLDTNSVDGSLVWKGEVYSFDALWQAADQGAYIQNGANAPIDYKDDKHSLAFNADGTKLVLTIDLPELDIDNHAIVTKFAKAVLFGYNADQEYTEVPFGAPVKAADQTGVKDGYTRYTVEIAVADYQVFNNQISQLIAGMGDYAGIDIFFTTDMFGVEGTAAYQYSIHLSEIPFPGND